MILSTGMATEQEIEEAVCTARDSGCKELVLLHCISSYPTPVEQAHLRQIQTLAERFKVSVGLSDHTLGTTAAVAAVALGACLIEKHFTLNRADKGPDSEFSMEPREFGALCQLTKEAWAALGSSRFSREQAEAGSKIFRRSLYFVRDLPRGHVITPADIQIIRPGFGLAPKKINECLGAKLLQDVKRGQPVEKSLCGPRDHHV
jgi:N-acetylneuraminate synthase